MVTEIGIISIVETLKEFRTILLSQKLRIYIDHKNLTCKMFNTNILLRWRLILEQYVPYIEYIKGEKNIVADALSMIPLNGNQETTQKSTYQKEVFSETNDIKALPEGTFPINLKLIQKQQRLEPSMIPYYNDSTCHKVISMELVILILAL